MSTNNYILNLLNIKDNNIHIYEKIDEKVIKGTNYKIIEGILTYNPNLEKIALLRFLRFLIVKPD